MKGLLLEFLQNHMHFVLTPWSRILLDKLTVTQLVEKFSAFYGIRRFITMFKRAATGPYIGLYYFKFLYFPACLLCLCELTLTENVM